MWPLPWYLLVQLLHLPRKLHLSKLSQSETPFWTPFQNSEYPRIFQVEPIRMRKNCYPLIWWILMRVTLPLTFKSANHFSGERGPLRGVTYVSSLNFKTCCFTYWGGSLVAVGILQMYLHFCCCNSFKPSLSCLLPFLLFYITVSRPCCLSKIIP